MFLCKEVLTKDEVKEILTKLSTKDWDVGYSKLDKKHKDNQEIRIEQEIATEIANKILKHTTVYNNAFITEMTLPVFNKYKNKGHYARHIDSFTQAGVRTDWSYTLFLTEPNTYEGGELVIEDVAHEPLKYKLAAGDMILYPSGKPHYVTDVTEGERIAVIGWGQSLIENTAQREILQKVVSTLRTLEAKLPEDMHTQVDVSFIYNNLIRMWSK